MRAGRLRHRLVIESHEGVRTEHGGVSQEYAEETTVWGSIEPLSGRELMQAQARDARVTHRIVMRYWRNLTPQYRIRSRDRVFNVLSMINVEERDRELVILAEEHHA